jgi:hypothetical protein
VILAGDLTARFSQAGLDAARERPDVAVLPFAGVAAQYLSGIITPAVPKS